MTRPFRTRGPVHAATRTNGGGLPRRLRTAKRAALLLLLSAFASPLVAQHAEVFYDHRPGPAGDNRLRYLLPGERRSTNPVNDAMHPGRPGLLEVGQGREACFVVENANPLLYTYSLGKKSITVEAPAGLAEIIAGLSGLLKDAGLPLTPVEAAKVMGFRESADLDLLDLYAAQVTALADSAARLEGLKQQSDDLVSLAPLFTRARQLDAAIRAHDSEAKAIFARGVIATTPEPRARMFRLIKVAHETAVKQAAALAAEFKTAEAAPPPRLCATMEESRLRLTLNVAPKAKPKEGEKSARPVEVVAEFDVDPVSTKTFEVVPAVLVSFGVTDASRFALRDNVITQTRDRRSIVSPGVMAMGRLGASPVWGAIGVSSGRDKADAFLGLVVRGGPSIVGSRLMIGAGFTLARVVTDLKAGRVGEPLPADVKKLDDLLAYDYRPGASVVFSLTGLAIGGDKSAGGSKPARPNSPE